ncbi:hypothetical protein BU16DRAFT_72944 [Lophium mytilinum]|uniref:Chitin-binding type-1 domain-containing protein n=1 Tax=Lophium mytilinum TaxID=390894 RepID=A0A6A6QQN2_9PEZI|nr:hypothetical protein BU16DRAFT_72944 [Lophium mytilinum]
MRPSLQFQLLFVSLCLASVAEERPACNADDCARAVNGTRRGYGHPATGTRDCISYMTTIVPVGTAVVETTEISDSTVTIYPPWISSTAAELIGETRWAKRHPVPQYGYFTTSSTKNPIPAYATHACTDLSLYSSACSCMGITAATITASFVTTTSTISKTITHFVTFLATKGYPNSTSVTSSSSSLIWGTGTTGYPYPNSTSLTPTTLGTGTTGNSHSTSGTAGLPPSSASNSSSSGTPSPTHSSIGSWSHFSNSSMASSAASSTGLTLTGTSGTASSVVIGPTNSTLSPSSISTLLNSSVPSTLHLSSSSASLPSTPILNSTSILSTSLPTSLSSIRTLNTTVLSSTTFSFTVSSFTSISSTSLWSTSLTSSSVPLSTPAPSASVSSSSIPSLSLESSSSSFPSSLHDTTLPTTLASSTGISSSVATSTSVSPCATGSPNARLCFGSCINPLTDNNNCGGCGNKCASGTECTNGLCARAFCRSLCGAFGKCGPEEDNCLCGIVAEGRGVCLDGDMKCSSLPSCIRSSECIPGYVCAVGTCCDTDTVRGVCVSEVGCGAGSEATKRNHEEYKFESTGMLVGGMPRSVQEHGFM